MKFKLYILMFVVFNIQSIPKHFKEIKCHLTPIKIDKKNVRTKEATTSKTALNWAGYVAATDLTNPAVNSVSAVFGSWKVPVLQSTNNSLCLIWVGIDGYVSSTIEQIGTSHEIRNGQQVNFAWFSMNPNNSFQINNFKMCPNDSISASVKFKGGKQFVLQIVNNTSQTFATVPLNLTRIQAQRLTAQWMVEANSEMDLANFGEIQFSNCQATINVVKQSISATSNCAMTMVNSTMVKSTNVERSEARAVVSNLSNNGKDFTVRWMSK